MSRPDGDARDIAPQVPDDVLDLLCPGDHAPAGPPATIERCTVTWLDVQDLLGGDPPWTCGRRARHHGQHIAFSHGSTHVAAVLPDNR